MLENYEKSSGEGINKHKLGNFFSFNTIGAIKDQILKLAGVPMCSNQEKYLGLPTLVGRMKYQTFEALKDRVWSLIRNWKKTFLPQAGKEVLLRAMIQSILTYDMSVFQLPQKVCKQITSTM